MSDSELNGCCPCLPTAPTHAPCQTSIEASSIDLTCATLGCNVLRGPRPAAWDQETSPPPCIAHAGEGLPDADWSTKIETCITHTILNKFHSNTIHRPHLHLHMRYTLPTEMTCPLHLIWRHAYQSYMHSNTTHSPILLPSLTTCTYTPVHVTFHLNPTHHNPNNCTLPHSTRSVHPTA